MKKRTWTRIFVATGTVAAIVAIMNNPDFEDGLTKVLVLTCLLFLGLAVYPVLKDQLNTGQGIKPLLINSSCSIRAAREIDLLCIYDHQKRAYSSADAVPHEVLLDWYQANPNGFNIIENGEGKVIGHFDVLPIRKSTLLRYKKGEIKETEILGDCLYPPDEKSGVTDLYIESFVVLDTNKHSRPIAVREVLRSFREIVCRVADPMNVDSIFGMAATSDGNDIMEHLGFQVVSGSDSRKDGHVMFQVDFMTILDKVQVLSRWRRLRS